MEEEDCVMLLAAVFHDHLEIRDDRSANSEAVRTVEERRLELR